ncbi:extracellular solute-binding protein [Paenibacillus eucommiae]|uniref:ABC-type glycerol-3-phosphate transport system substrate-binding protein n=1 Tax=Paenibacillus eucommiae TaxID=1355755 RepID=A0ABS4J8X3_9BACL|nr:extracellular solute-binding protein [Paenibacillus eucommiae]MBP1996289.1 ABC-type glycerol-3-phosphate transport system substrate-binding protein [Paenibacillus eucommiae]
MKKWLTAALIISLLAVAALGCSSNKSTSSSSSTPAATGNSSQAPSVAPKKVEKVYLYSNLGNLTATTDTSKPEAIEEVRKVIIDKIGIEIISIIPPKGSEDDKLNILLASNEPLDIFKGSMTVHQTMGAAMPLNDLLDKYGQNSKKLWPNDWAGGWEAMATEDGKIWAIPEVPPLAGNAVLLRDDWLKELNLQMPKTIDELEQILKAFKEKDPAGNGQTIPLLTSLDELNNSLAAGWLDFGYGNWVDADGKVKPPVLAPGYKEFLVKMADWYQKGYIYKESFSTNTEQVIELIKQNRVAGSAQWHSRTLGNLAPLRKNAPDANYVVADQLRGPKGNIMSMSGVTRTGYMINKNAKNPEGAMKYINWLHSSLDNYMLAYFGIEGKHWRWVDKQKGIYEQLNRDYLGDLITAGTYAYTVQFRTNNPDLTSVFDYYANQITNTTNTKKPALYNVDYKFDAKVIAGKVPTLNDITRMIEQETIKFIMGARPIAEYDNFLQELNKAGLDKWIEAYTAEYQAAK